MKWAAVALVLAVLPARAEIAIQNVTSPGGIAAWLVADHEIPFTALEIRFKGGTSLDLPGSRGAVNLMAAVGKSNLNLMLGLKPTEKLLSSDPLLRPILKNFESSKDSEGFFGLSVMGTLSNPRVVPRRR
jgi:hypothetical protein